MDDPTPSAGGAEAPPLSEAIASAGPARPFDGGPCILAAGGRWQGYKIEGPVPDAATHLYEATSVSRMEKVLIAAVPLAGDPARRREVWEMLSTRIPAEARVLACIEAIEEDGWRFEVMNCMPGVALREWITCHQADGRTQKHLLQQLLTAVNALHAQGVVHLNIRPDTIHVEERGGRLEIVLGALGAAMLYARPQFDAIQADPLYAPPEAVEPAGVASGNWLRAWDWWSVGRVMQELVLGRHVMSTLFGADVIREPTPALCERARALLLERDPPGVRAGAVEAMGVTDPGSRKLLEGLLTTAREARWGGEAVRRWLANEPVSVHYELPRDARFFSWKGHGYTLPEAVAFFRTEANWADGNTNISEPDNPETLAHFLATVPEHERDWQKLQGLYAQMEAPGWGEVPQVARRCLTTAAAWALLGPQPGTFVIQGRRLDAAGLDGLLGRGRESNNCALVKALMSGPALALIKSLDPAAAQTLALLAAAGLEALRCAERHQWIEPEDLDREVRVLRLALAAPAELQAQADRVRATYATCGDVTLAALLADQRPAPWVNVLLIVTAEEAPRFGYITKEEYARQHLAEREERCRRLRAAVFWRRLGHLLRAGRPGTGGWNGFMLLLGGVAVLGLAVAHDAVTTLSLLAGLLGLRRLLGWRVRVLARRLDPAAPPWTWRDGPDRCLADLQRIWPTAPAATLPALRQELAACEAARAALLPAGKPSRAVRPPVLVELWTGVVAGAFLGLFGFLQLAQSYVDLPAAAVATAGHLHHGAAPVSAAAVPVHPAPAADPLLSIPGITPELVAKLRRGEYEVVHGSFGDTLHGPLRPWDVPQPPVLSPLPVTGRAVATPDQRAFARVSGELLLGPYGQKPINALLAVRVPASGGIGLMLYSAREHKLVDGNTLLLLAPPAARTWYQLDHRKVVYLGAPPDLEVENSLALQ